MKILRYALAAAVLALPMLVSIDGAQAATASQYSAKGHGRQPMMSNRPSRAMYHHNRGSMRHHRYMHRRGY